MADFNYNDSLNQYLEKGSKMLRDFIQTNIYNGKGSEIDRVARYYLYWKFYRGEHYRDYNENMIAFNYIRAFIDKVNNFVIGENSISFKVTRYDGDVVEENLSLGIEKLVLKNWRKNKIDLLIHEILQMGSITGDVWVAVTWLSDKKSCAITCFDSRYCFPVFDTMGVNGGLSGFTVRQPIEKDQAGYTVLITEYTTTKIRQYKRISTADYPYDPSDTKTLLISETDNKLGAIPVVHIKNKPSSEGYYGVSDAKDILKLNKVYNEVAQEMKVIVDYHTAPVTIVTGATVKNLQRQVGNVWSGLPPEANVFNLSNEADISGIVEYMNLLKNGMHEISDVPENVLGKIQSISGTSAAALKLTYQPLVQQANLKSLTYGEGIVEINELILAHYNKYGRKDSIYSSLPDFDSSDFRIEPVFTYGFPNDKMVQLQEFQMEQQLRLNSRKKMMNALGYNNVEDLMTEIDDDAMESARLQHEIMTEYPTTPTQVNTGSEPTQQ